MEVVQDGREGRREAYDVATWIEDVAPLDLDAKRRDVLELGGLEPAGDAVEVRLNVTREGVDLEGKSARLDICLATNLEDCQQVARVVYVRGATPDVGRRRTGVSQTRRKGREEADDDRLETVEQIGVDLIANLARKTQESGVVPVTLEAMPYQRLDIVVRGEFAYTTPLTCSSIMAARETSLYWTMGRTRSIVSGVRC